MLLDCDGDRMSEVQGILGRLAEEIHATAIEHGWWGDLTDYVGREVESTALPVERNFGEVIALIHSEASEALEAYRDGMPINRNKYECPKCGLNESGVPHTMVLKPVGVPSEMADIIIRVLDACAAYGIDIDQAVREKMTYNKTRPFKHGRAH